MTRARPRSRHATGAIRGFTIVGACIATLGFAPAVSAFSDTAPTGVISGAVVSADGSTGVDANVQVFAWPDESVTDQLPDGGTVTTPLIGSTSADSTGNYAVSPDLSSLPADYSSASGDVDVEIRVSDYHGFQDWFATLDGTDQRITFDMAAQSVDSSAEDGPQHVAVDEPAAGTQATYPVPVCTDWQGKEFLTHRPEKFVNAFGRPHAPVEVSESVGATHSLGIALRIEGGDWGASGSSGLEVHDAAGGSQTFSYAHLIFNAVNYRHYHMDCTGYGAHDRDMNKASGFYDLISQWQDRSPTTWHYCVTKSSGVWHKSNGSNTTFDAGVSLPYLSVTSHISFTSDLQLTWRPNDAVYLCGSNSLGWVEAPQAGAKKIERTGGCPPAPGPCLAGSARSAARR